jgi:tripartite-type tricarboxylate transporter receptor subunit TctC
VRTPAKALGTAALALWALWPVGCALAQGAYPSRPVKVVVPFPPGGGFDGLGRPLFEKLGAALGQPMLMEYHAGAAGNIGVEYAVRAAPDGYTLLFVNSFITTNPAVYKSIGYDPVKDLAPIAKVAATNTAMTINAALPAKNLRELIAFSKTRTLTFGTPGIGTMPHMAGEMLNMEGTMRLQHIPYKGTAQAISDALGGQIDMVIVPLTAVAPHIRAGKLRGIAVLSPQRAAFMPELPTIREQGVPFQASTWYALFAPAATPEAIVRRLNAAAVQVLEQPELLERLRTAGYDPGSSTPEALGTAVKTELQMWQRIVAEARIPRE